MQGIMTESGHPAGPTAMVISPTREEFDRIGDEHNLAVIWTEVSSDLETPVSAFMKLRDSHPCFLLESAESDEMWGRYSFLGFDPGIVARLEDGALIVSDGDREEHVPGDPVKALFELVEAVRVFVPESRDEMPFTFGAVGYFGYDVLPYLEKVKLAEKTTDVPEMLFMFPRNLVMFDHLRSRMRLCALVETGGGPGERAAAFEGGTRRIASMAERLIERLPTGMALELPADAGFDGREFEDAECNVTRDDFEGMVAASREHILAGDAFQIVVSQRFTLPLESDALSVYRQLRAGNPSPYMFYLELPDVTLVGSSPEPMVSSRSGKAIIRPIAGTRPRGVDAAGDARLAEELKSDEKERAEHIMLVDLARNDLGRVCVPGTVRVTSLMEIERYSHVMHMVSEVEGAMKEGKGNYDLLRASFPAGTVSGAPKVRACEIIDSLEPDGRGPYAGAIGYLSYSGDMDTCIAIRTAVVRDGRAHVQAGAGIVADSRPEDEYIETMNKARALMKAVRSAGRMTP
jgi:anthranilate synthase component 1